MQEGQATVYAHARTLEGSFANARFERGWRPDHLLRSQPGHAASLACEAEGRVHAAGFQVSTLQTVCFAVVRCSDAMEKPHYKEAIAKEFMTAMQAKGKLPRFVTDANEQYVSAQFATLGSEIAARRPSTAGIPRSCPCWPPNL
jgi:hypothetical protein